MKSKPIVLDIIVQYIGGHFIQLHLATEQAVNRLGWSYRAIVDKDCPPDVFTQSWIRKLSNAKSLGIASIGAHLGNKNPVRAKVHLLWSIFKLGFQLANELRFVSRKSDTVVMYMEWFNGFHLVAAWLAVVLSRVFFRRSRKLTLWLHMHDIPGRSHWGTRSGKYALKLLKKSYAELRITAFTQELAEELSVFLECDVFESPFAMSVEWISKIVFRRRMVDDGKNGDAKHKPLICWIPGRRAIQGADVVPGLISHPSGSHLSRGAIEIQAAAMLCEAEPTNGIVLRKLSDWLDDEEYLDQLLKCDIIILPYSNAYKVGVSAIFIEAIIAGKITLVSRGTTMEKALRKHGLDNLIFDWDIDFSWQRVQEIALDVEVRHRIVKMGTLYEEAHGVVSYSSTIFRTMMA